LLIFNKLNEIRWWCKDH